MSLCEYYCHLSIYLVVLLMFSMFSSSALRLMSSLLTWTNRALIGLLNKSVAGLGNPMHIGVILICNKMRLTLLLL